ncbi:MAG: asparaginase [Planctomycetota bacterium]
MTSSPNGTHASPYPGVAAPQGVNPTLVEVWRGGAIESVHRGAWVLTDGAGNTLEGAGDWETPIFTRSSIKALQALPLLTSGAAERFSFDHADLALAVSSHNGEPCHTERAAAILGRVGLDVGDLRCGPQTPGDPATRRSLTESGDRPTALHNNCSGKHSGFLALADHLGIEHRHYLAPDAEGQVLIRRAIAVMSDVDEADLVPAIDGCSAPTYRLPLRNLATAFARLTAPTGLDTQLAAHCRRLCDAVAQHPELIAGTHKRLCTDLARVTAGRLFPKIGAEAVYVIGVRDADRALAVKVDDGDRRGLHALVLALIERLGLAGADELDALQAWRPGPLKNYAGLDVGRIEVRLE